MEDDVDEEGTRYEVTILRLTEAGKEITSVVSHVGIANCNGNVSWRSRTEIQNWMNSSSISSEELEQI